MSDLLKDLSDLGVSIWLDDLSRDRLTSGSLKDMIDNQHVVGVTTNPAIFNKAIGDGSMYADQIKQLAQSHVAVDDAILAMTTDDVRNACDVFQSVYEATGGQDGRVSIEVDPRLAHQTAATIDAARLLWATVDRPNAMIKIPATDEGYLAITQAIAEGISVNVTLLFSVDQYRACADAYMTGLEQALEAGKDISAVSSVASFFVSRVDTLIDPKLDEIGTDQAKAIRSKLGVANAQLAYQAYEALVASSRWQRLEAADANRQRPLWASTGTKDKTLSPTLYVDELAVKETVNTLPEVTLNAAATVSQLHGDAVTGSYGQAQWAFEQLAALGIDFKQCTDQLMQEGVQKFEVAWNELILSVQKALEEA